MARHSVCPTCGHEIQSVTNAEATHVRNGDEDALQTGGQPTARNAGIADELAQLRSLPARSPQPGEEQWLRERTGHETGCVICGGELPANSGVYWKRVSPNRMTCSNACRQRAYRIRKTIEKEIEHEQA